MDPATQFAGTIAAAGAAYLAAGLLLDGVRRLTRAQLPGLPSLRPLLAAVTLLAMLGRVGPAAATTPPPAQRLGGHGATGPGAAADVGPAVPVEAAAALSPTLGATHTVQPGDSLWAIAGRALGDTASAAEVAAYWPLVYEANAAVIGPDPHLIHPGQVLELPEAP